MKRTVSILIAIFIICTLCLPFTAMAGGNYSALSGSGTESDPYRIANNADWDAFTSAVKADPDHGKGCYFKLTGDIGSAGNEVSTKVNEFCGVFDGNGKTIWHSGTQLLFYKNSGEIKNVVTNGSVREEERRGGGGAICYANSGVIDRCVNYAPLEGGMYVGGICGRNSGLIVNCINYAPITQTMGNTGGICGSNPEGLILNCINTAPVSGCGICGYIHNRKDINIAICFNCGKPSAGYGITMFAGRGEHPKMLYDCSFLTPIDDIDYEASNNEDTNEFIMSFGGPVCFIEDGVENMNWAIENYNNQTGRTLYKWKLGTNGLPTYAETFPTATVLSEGNIWIIAIVAVVVIAGIAALVIVKKKTKPALASGTDNTDEE